MRQAEEPTEYLDCVAWDEALTDEQRRERGPFNATYAVGAEDRAAAAVAAARDAAQRAAAIEELVVEQAVFALTVAGCTTRQIEERAGISKAKASRILRRLGRDESGRPQNLGHGFSSDWAADVRGRVRAIWSGAADLQHRYPAPRPIALADQPVPARCAGGTCGVCEECLSRVAEV